MAAGDRYSYGNGRFYTETLHGPNVETTCVDCGKTTHARQEDPPPAPRCANCGRWWHGLPGTVVRHPHTLVAPLPPLEET